MTLVRVLLVDSNDDFLDGLSAWLGREPNVEVAGSARTGEEAIELVESLRPDLLLMDVTMSRMNGFEAARQIKANPEAPVVVLTTFHDSEAARHEAWAAGADALIAKADVTARVRALVRDLVAGRIGDKAARPREPRKGQQPSSTKQVPKGDVTQ